MLLLLLLLLARRAGPSHWPKIYINRHQWLRNFSLATLALTQALALAQAPLLTRMLIQPEPKPQL